MNLKELKDHVDFLVAQAQMQHLAPEEVSVGVKVKTVNSVGGTPTVGIKGIHLGFDWDHGRCLIQPEADLREIGRDELAALRKSHEELGWSWYKINKIKRENEVLTQKLNGQVDSKS